MVIEQPFPEQLEADIRAAYETLAAGSGEEASFAVRSSATAEDLPDASFAGQQETFLSTCAASTRCSPPSGRCSPRCTTTGRSPTGCTIPSSTLRWRSGAGVQKMVRSDLGASGVLFTVDTESGFDQAVFITSAYGLGEGVVRAR